MGRRPDATEERRRPNGTLQGNRRTRCYKISRRKLVEPSEAAKRHRARLHTRLIINLAKQQTLFVPDLMSLAPGGTKPLAGIVDSRRVVLGLEMLDAVALAGICQIVTSITGHGSEYARHPVSFHPLATIVSAVPLPGRAQGANNK